MDQRREEGAAVKVAALGELAAADDDGRIGQWSSSGRAWATSRPRISTCLRAAAFSGVVEEELGRALGGVVGAGLVDDRLRTREVALVRRGTRIEVVELDEVERRVVVAADNPGVVRDVDVVLLGEVRTHLRVVGARAKTRALGPPSRPQHAPQLAAARKGLLTERAVAGRDDEAAVVHLADVLEELREAVARLLRREWRRVVGDRLGRIAEFHTSSRATVRPRKADLTTSSERRDREHAQGDGEGADRKTSRSSRRRG